MYKVRRQLRANDFDIYNHVNQANYHVLLEDVRASYVFSLLSRDFSFVIARVELDYRREVPFGETEVEVGMEVTRVGRSSFVLQQAIWRMDGVLAAEGPATFVAWDPERRGSRPLTEEQKSILEAELAAKTEAAS